MEVEGANPFKVRAYERGARALEGMAEDLGTLVREERLTSVPGIGTALASTISELFHDRAQPRSSTACASGCRPGSSSWARC